MNVRHLLNVSEDLEIAGLIWKPEVGDEVTEKKNRDLISVFVDPQGLSMEELRASFLWIPTVEQMIHQLEARQAILFHAGLELTETNLCYKTIIQSQLGPIETKAESLRVSVGLALRDLLLSDSGSIH